MIDRLKSRLERPRNETGFTLIELVIATGLLGVVIAPIAIGMLFGLVNSNGTRDRIADSASAEIFATYFPGDIQSSGSTTLVTPPAATLTSVGVFLTGTTGCPGSVFGGADVTKLRLRWQQPNDATKFTTVVYFSRPSGTLLELWRAECPSVGSPSTDVMVQHLAPTAGFATKLICDDGTESDGTTNCGSKPRTVTVTLKAFNPESQSDSYDGTTFTYTATRRADP